MAEFATSVASNLVLKLGQYLFAPIGRQFRYVLRYKNYVQDLENSLENLDIVREKAQYNVEEAVNDGKLLHYDFEQWWDSVENKTKEAQNLLKRCESAKIYCLWGWLPNPVVRHPIGKKAKKLTQVVKRLHYNWANSTFLEVYFEGERYTLEPRAVIAKEVMEAIVDDKVCVVGVYGPGGVGKSMLLGDVKWRVKKEKRFNVVVTINVSRNPNLRRIQGEIAYALGLRLINVETARGRADRLRERLESHCEKDILIILDNLWKKLELNDVGIPCGEDNKVRGCKLLLTSRYRDVLRDDMASDREFRLNELDNGEARILFERTVGNRANDPEIKPLLDGVVKNCGGLPLLIVSSAERLRHGEIAEWRNALTNVEGLDVKSIVEPNYTDLKEERLKSLFLLCALISGRTRMTCFLAYGMGLGLYNKFCKTIQNARDRLIMDLHCLQDSSLLLDSDNMEEIRMRDIFVDVALSIASTEWNALVGRKDYGFKEWSKDHLSKCMTISFPYVGINELPEKLDCPNLRMLLLLENTSSLKIPQLFFESMEKLQVLGLTGFSFASLPSSLEFLENLKSLCLDGCHLDDVAILGKLKGLEFLSFYRSAIPRLPKEIGELIELRCLNLTCCAMLKVIEPGVLGSLVNLEELHMEDSFDQWEVEDEALESNASLSELKNMKKLSTLYIAIPHSAYLPRDLPFEKLDKHKIQIGGTWAWSGVYTESRTLKLKLDSGNLLLEEWVQKCLQRTQDLHLNGLQGGNDCIHDLCIKGFQELKHLHVQNSPSFQYVVRSIENVQYTAFTSLESMFLENLNKLEKICRGCLALESFNKLKIVKVDNCGEIKHLFPLSMKRIIPNLEEIEISRCHLMQQIVANTEVDKGGHEIEDDMKVKPCNLRRLIVRNLPKMTSFYKTADHSVDFFDGQQVIELQKLEAITIERCQLIQEVFDLEGLTASGEVEILSQLTELTLSDLPSLGHIWNKNPRRALCFRNLSALKVHDCENLRFLFSSSMAKALKQIKEIEIVSCKLMENIIDVQEEESGEATTINTLEFPLLTSLSLKELLNLKTFSYGNFHIHCPSLKRLKISGCPKLMTFS